MRTCVAVFLCCAVPLAAQSIRQSTPILTSAHLDFDDDPTRDGNGDQVFVTIAGSQTVNEGSVTVNCGKTKLFGPRAVSYGLAEFIVSSKGFPPGKYYCTASYTDSSGTFAPSSGSAYITVEPQASTVDLTTNSPLQAGDTATLTAKIITSAYPPIGTITFSANGIRLGTVKIANGTATLHVATTHISPGDYTITASYSGDSVTASSRGFATVTLSAPSTARP